MSSSLLSLSLLLSQFTPVQICQITFLERARCINSEGITGGWIYFQFDASDRTDENRKALDENRKELANGGESRRGSGTRVVEWKSKETGLDRTTTGKIRFSGRSLERVHLECWSPVSRLSLDTAPTDCQRK